MSFDDFYKTPQCKTYGSPGQHTWSGLSFYVQKNRCGYLKMRNRKGLVFMYYKSENTFIRALYAPGFSALTMSLFNMYLTVCFNPYTGKDNNGYDQYCKKTFLSTSIRYEGAALFQLTAIPILEGKDPEKQIEAVLRCGKNASLLFEYKPDENNQMTAYLTINKNNETIPFKFPTHEYKVKENGQVVTKVVQHGLAAFVSVLDGYLTGVGADNHLSKLPDEILNPTQAPLPF